MNTEAKIQIEVTERHLCIIRDALEAYGRIRMGQFDMAVSCNKNQDDLVAWEIMQTFRQYLALQRSNGIGNPMSVEYDDPLKMSEEPLPVIKNFSNSIDYPIEDKEIQKSILESCDNMEYDNAWKKIDEYFKDFSIGSDQKEIILNDPKKVLVRFYKPYIKNNSVDF